jgi:hypothetical protein
MRNVIALLFLLALAATSIHPARAQDDLIVGTWLQVESNAGACPQCRISFAPAGGALRIAANNGWSARVGLGGAGDAIQAAGAGEWAPGKPGTTAGRPFRVFFRLFGQRLYMSMDVAMEDGSRRLVWAVFERPWFGA